ncbi:hypothetical protein FRX31_021137 [Thalictrum thalictroides]|uniref:Uncharacterized protein n=1 Tax=Thalictrum thalictroides TaxID=46969 RepID=A0A7J6VYU3_THATH|nr:hypothetical protein FRX31_021137 [Thalictrum thalictroides]
MTTVPVKSQPLHNFSLPQHLKWGKNQMNNQRCRKPNNNESSRGDSPSIDHQINQNHRSSASDVESDGGSSQKDQEIVNHKNIVGSRTVKNRFPVSTCSNGGVGSGSPSMINKADEVRSSNLVIRIPKGSKEESVSKNKSVVVVAGGGGGTNGGVGVEGGVAEGGETEEPMGKPWNLRPRRAVVKTNNNINNNNNDNGGGVTKNGGGEGDIEEKQENQQSKSLRLKRGVVETENVEKKKEKKIVFSVSLSREDIEDDFYNLTGSKPPRRPKKRNRNIQRQLDNLFPGLWLSGVTADSLSYSVPEVPAKKLKA